MAGRRDWTRETLAAGVREGDRRALARAITLVENGDPLAYGVVADLYPSTGKAYAVGPVELARQGALAMDRARAAVAALRALGLDQAAIDRQADLGAEQVAAAENRDPALIQETLLDELRRTYGADKVNAAAADFSNSHPEPNGLFDLGDVSDEVARSSGYGCAIPGT